MTLLNKDDFKVSEEAALWLHRLSREDTPEVRAEFSAWIKKAAVNLEEFLFAQAVWKELDHVDAAMRDKFSTGREQSSVVNLGIPAPPAATLRRASRVTRRNRAMTGIAAGLAVALLGWFVPGTHPPGTEMYTTAVGDQKAIKLSDGSVIHLNTDTRAEVRYSAEARTIRLLGGEALFTVEHDPVRPFYVLTGDARIEALGTQFNVYRSSTATRVTVVDGVVQVSRGEKTREDAVRLAAGDEAQIVSDRIVRAAAPNVQQAVAWRARRLMFPGNRIADIAEEFNRYNRTHIRVEGEALRERKMSGVFDADDPSPLIQHLSRDPGVMVARDADEILIRPRGPQD